MTNTKKSKKQRLEEQALRQKRARDQAREMRRPNRDDIARVLLWEVISTAHASETRDELLAKVCNAVLRHLAEQGFDESASEAVFWELADKYQSGIPPFRIKRHLGV
jgi:hypothetical protein